MVKKMSLKDEVKDMLTEFNKMDKSKKIETLKEVAGAVGSIPVYAAGYIGSKVGSEIKDSWNYGMLNDIKPAVPYATMFLAGTALFAGLWAADSADLHTAIETLKDPVTYVISAAFSGAGSFAGYGGMKVLTGEKFFFEQ